jgi:hypothetical protein
MSRVTHKNWQTLLTELASEMRFTQEYKMKSFLICTVDKKLFGLQWAMKCIVCTEHMGRMRNVYTILVRKSEEITCNE